MNASLIAVTVTAALGAGVATGQDFPSKPVRIITSAVGGGSDFTARLIAQGISGPLAQTVIIDNRTGFLATEAVFKAPPDGYTLLVNGATLWITPLMQKTPYDVMKDFSPISLISREIYIVSVHPSVPVKSAKELIALAKTRPGELNYSATSIGGTSYLATELFKSMADANIVGVAYKGTAQAITGLISGEVQVMITDAGLLLPHVKSGKLRALAVTSAEPSALAPGLPTVAASGVPGYEAVGRTGIWAPGKTPAAIINRLNQDIVRFLNTAEAKERVINAGAEIIASSPGESAAIIQSDSARMDKLIKGLGLQAK